MRTATIATSFALALGILAHAPAGAQQIIGGHDETSENHNVMWTVAGPTPGTVGPGGVGGHLLLSEVVVTPTAGEYIEICNPTGVPIDLSNYYLSDDWFTGVAPPSGYYQLPQAGYAIGINFDFTARFPAGSVIPPGGVRVIAVDGAAFLATYGIVPDFEINPTSPVPDMIIVSNNAPLSSALLTNSAEMVVLFFWDGVSDNVCDVDYVQWGSLASGNGVDKTGLLVDGPDPDAVASPHLPDTPPGAQVFTPAPGAGTSILRQSCQEAPEAAPGNGCVPGGPTPARGSTWGQVKVRYR